MEQQVSAVFGAFALILIGVIGYLLDQRNKQVNETLKELQNSMTEVREDMQSTAQLHTFLNDRLKVVELENSTFRNSFHSIDMWLATMGRRPNAPRPPYPEPPYERPADN